MKHLYKLGWLCAGMLWLLLAGLPSYGQGQGYQMPTTGTTDVTACSGILYDDGGLGGNYSPNADGVTILRPSSGSRIQLQFTAFETEAFFDRLTIYDGASTNDPILGIYDGTGSPGTVVASNPGGVLTVRLTSDGVSNLPGFAATISCVPLAPLPDLQPQGPALTPLTVAAGGTISATVTIFNRSVSAASSSSVGYYLSTNATLDATDQLLTSTLGGPLPANQASTRLANVTIPAGTANGNYFLLFVADFQNAVSESNEQNNVVAASFTVVPVGVDLVIQNPFATPTITSPGTPMTLNSVIRNLGTTTASSSTVGYYLSTNNTLDAADQLLTSSTGGPLLALGAEVRQATATIPAGTTPGTYFLLFVADPQNVVGETNEQNNVAVLQISVVTPSVDLTVSQPSSPLTAPAGGSFLASALLTNLGNTTASTSNMGVYLSTNATLDAGDQLLVTAIGGQLGGGQSIFRSATATIPAGTALGNYFLLFVADPQNTVSETNEQNNLISRTLTVAAPSVDLQVQQVSLSPTLTVAGANVSVFVSVVNVGNVASPASTVGYYFSTNNTLDAADQPLTTSTLAPMPAGALFSTNGTVTVPAGTAPGTYFILGVADHTNQINEPNEQNNVGAAALTVVVPRVDLQVVQAALNPLATTAGGTVNVFSTVTNVGNTPAPVSTLGYYLSTNNTLDAADIAIGQTTVQSINANGFASPAALLTIPAGTAAGAYFVLFVADAPNAISEINEQNNVAAAALSIVLPGVDLIVSQAALARNAVSAGGTLAANGNIFNQGTTTAASSALGYYLSTDNVLNSADVLLTTVPGGALTAGSGGVRGATLTIPAATTPGNYFVLLVADPLNAVSETNEQNNVASVPLTVTPPFSGTVIPFSGTATLTSCGTTIYDHGGTGVYSDNANGSLTISPATAGARVRVTIRTFDTESGFDFLNIYDGPTTSSPLLASYNGSVAPGTAVTATNAAGVLTMQFITDVSVVRDGFEAVISCVGGGGTGAPDLLVQQPTASPLTLGAGSALSVGSIIRNQGTNDASSSSVGYYLSTNTILDAGDVLLGTSTGGLLAAGATANRSGSFTVPAATAAGTYRLLVVADPQNTVTESDEQNNVTVFASSITVTAAGVDLAVSQLTVLPSPVRAGGTIAVTAFHENLGTAAAAAHTIGVYLSTNTTLDAGDVLLTSSSVGSMAAGFGITRVLSGISIPSGTAPGPYFVLFVADSQNAVSETNEQNNVASLALRVDPGLAVREQAAGYAIQLLPNPTATGSFEVRFEGAGATQVAELTLYNSLGQRVSQQPLTLRGTAARAVVSTQALSHGVYTLRITGQNLHVVRRVVVE
ncbi:T9SS type A sorting domain-containing protein [Hymenobacter gummosus]|uniref:T9SS type A sorting domain-containing protein n=1 Tax=Hymenobacter gummosus TaxID=1776032 RepID=A0A431U818_9BACT|nr:CARDB domain-containing protein [Hymenobacter gummosus]RTQ53178.1 T9SS type A sorting domain-containing protein [Hymenobacter gummosus]